MSENKFKNTTPSSPTPKVEPTPAKKKKKSSPVGKILKGDFLTEGVITRYMPFAAFLTVLALIYIANAYYAERKVNKINQTNKKVKDLHSKYVSVKADLMFGMQRAELSNGLVEEGIKESTTPPIIIKVENSKTELIY
ncbi:MAG TPA: FtsL-like putative cell division protein [Bacteroidia bacterium]